MSLPAGMSERNPGLEEHLFEAALSKTSDAERAAFLDSVCQGDPGLRARLDQLLEGHFQAQGFLHDAPANIPCEPIQPPSEDQTASTFIGRYKLLEKIGEGGFGEVWMAEQKDPVKRRVALKIIKLGMDTKQVVARFEAERQALALMDHPNIAKVLDGGATDTGRPYFVMELVRGIRITEYCDQNKLSTAERLKLFIQVCHALQHAHQKGIIHRDIKPSNILVTAQDGVPVPKVIDFGIAKATQQELTDKTVFTQFRLFLGTPAYVSPEQADLTSADIDTRSDIYSLGVLLYELLTGRTPFDSAELSAAGLDEMRRRIRETEPMRPSTRLSALTREELTTTAQRRGAEAPRLVSQIRGDLDWIAMKCLEKDRNRRYETANGLARDIERHLGNEPVLARPPSRVYEFQRTLRRHWVGFAAITAVILALAIGAIVSSLEAQRARKAERVKTSLLQSEATQRQRAESGEKFTQRLLYAAKMKLAQEAWEHNQVGRVRELLEETSTNEDRGFEWYYWQRQIHLEQRRLVGHLDTVSAVACLVDGVRIVTGCWDGTVKVWDADRGTELFSIKADADGIDSVAVSPDGQRLVAGGTDPSARLWNLATRTPILALKGHRAAVKSVSFSADGKRIVTGSFDSTAKVWDAESGTNLLTLRGHGDVINSAIFSADGQRIITGSSDQTARIWDAFTGVQILLLKGHDKPIHSVAVSPGGDKIATASDDGTCRLWDGATGNELKTLRGHEEEVYSVAFSPDGRRIVTGSSDQTARVWDANSGEALYTFKGHVGRIQSVAFMPDGGRVVTGSEDSTARIWEVPGGSVPLRLDQQTNALLVAVFSPDGRQIVTGGTDRMVRVWSAESGQELLTFAGHQAPVHTLNVSSNGKWIVTGSEDRTVKVWDAETGTSIRTLKGHKELIRCAKFAGARIVTCSSDGNLKIWNAQDGAEVLSSEALGDNVWPADISPDGNRVVYAREDGILRLCETTSGRLLHKLEGHRAEIDSVAFSSSGQRIVSGSQDQTARIWDAATGKVLHILKGHSGKVREAVFSPDESRIVTGSGDRTVKVWDAATGEELLSLNAHADAINSVGISAEQRRITAVSSDNTARIWEAATQPQVAAWRQRELADSKRVESLSRERWTSLARERKAREQDASTIKSWLVLVATSPQDQSGSEALAEEQIPGESKLRPHSAEKVLIGQSERPWNDIPYPNYPLTFTRGSKDRAGASAAYAVSYIVSQTQKSNLCMRVGSEGPSKVYLNGREIYRQESDRSYAADQDEVKGVQLEAGLNVLVFKLVSVRALWVGSIRFTEADGSRVIGIRATTSPP